ncbi:SusC/RagA family TonB-linked outer membrane protein [Terrimonas ferruginea]|uniref:SusC/RagA family TonB-linked outer membrane protein n=1 Tax=Terrimonas ferruginea TaxID=249 RepID=UPI0004180823|nr:TonB-dependent receptor [Terrimonas ferruginea]
MKRMLLAIGYGLFMYVPAQASPGFTDDHYTYDRFYFQEKIINGKITNDRGEPLSGVAVQIKGTTKSTLSKEDGSFSIAADQFPAILTFSYVGMEAKEVSVTSTADVQVQLKTLENIMDDVVVVGYTTQKKVNLTGSVSSVSGATLSQRPAPTTTNLLQGRVTGLQVVQPSGQPGRDEASLLIRGRGSFQTASSPLVLIDGVVGSLGNLSPDDVENVTVLKDAASASIYGARAANGVILVTTRKGRKGQPVISYRFNIARHNATALPDFITNSVEYMEMYRKAAIRQGLPEIYTQARIDAYKNSTDRNLYPNFDYVDYYVNPATVTNHNLSVSGGSDKSTYNFSLSYLDQDGLLPVYNFKRYNALLNYSNQLSKSITFGTSVNVTYKNRTDPPFLNDNMMLLIYAAGPLYGPYLPDGSGRIAQRAYQNEGRNRNPATVFAMGYQNTKEYNLNGQAYLDIKLFKGLTWSSKVAVNYIDEYYKMYQRPVNTYLLQERETNGDYKFFDNGPPDILGVTDQYSKIIQPTVYSTLRYEKRIGDHQIGALAGYEQLYYRYQTLRANRPNSAFPNLTELSGYSPTNQTLFNTSPRLAGIGTNPAEWAMQSFFGRVNYDFKGKYLLEANLRYDGTSKVSPDYRWGVFPSFSVGWRASQEDFIRDRFSWISDLKLRGSYGTLGNQDISTYAYQRILTTDNIGYPFGNTSLTQGAVLNTLVDQSVRWESTRVLDLGFDLEIKRGLLGITFDWFRKTTSDILANQPIPSSLGLSAPIANDGRLRNQGVELELRHQHTIGKVGYGVNGLISMVKNKVLYIRTPSIGSNIRRTGDEYDAHYLYVWDGIFQVEDIGNPRVPVHALNPNPKPGDLKMKDLNGDGVVDANDRKVVKGAYPNITYSFGFNVDYAGFGLTGFFQGVEGTAARVNNWGIDPFMQGTAPTTKWRNAWTPENRSNTMPAMYISGYQGVANYSGSTYYLMNSSYLRLKNIMLSYTFGKPVISRIRASNLMVYVSADNLLTFTKYEGGDPERSGLTGNFAQYPQVKIFNAGINIKF